MVPEVWTLWADKLRAALCVCVTVVLCLVGGLAVQAQGPSPGAEPGTQPESRQEGDGATGPVAHGGSSEKRLTGEAGGEQEAGTEALLGFYVPLEWFVVPIMGYTPDTSVALATVGIARFRFAGSSEESRPSTLASLLTWTFKNQLLVRVGPQIYMDNEQWYFRGEVNYEDWPELFFGVGPKASRDDQEKLERRSLRVQGDLRYALYKRNLYLGLFGQHVQTEIPVKEPGGLLDQQLVVGSEGGTVSGIGPSLVWDTRDSDVFARRGQFLRFQTIFYRRDFGGDFDHDVISIDARTFTEVAPDHILAFQVLGRLSSGEVPFFNMALLGGVSQMRGFLEGRFRDNHMLVGQAEYRSPYIWRLSFVGFASAGQVARRVDEFELNSVKLSGGGGVRFAVNRKEGINMRADFGFAQDEGFGAYVAFIEAF